jgi:hypothetical protein
MRTKQGETMSENSDSHDIQRLLQGAHEGALPEPAFVGRLGERLARELSKTQTEPAPTRAPRLRRWLWVLVPAAAAVIAFVVVAGQYLHRPWSTGAPVKDTGTAQIGAQDPEKRAPDSPAALAAQPPPVNNQPTQVSFNRFPVLKRPPLVKEPVYQSKNPQYAVLVFGPKAETRLWLVLDLAYDPLREKPGEKDSLYIDLNGNGNITDPGERVPVETVTMRHFEWVVKREVETHLPRFTAPDIVTRDGKKYTGLTVDVGSYLAGGFRPTTLKVHVPGCGTQSIGPAAMEYLLRLGDSPANAPIIRFDGPLTMRVRMIRGLMNSAPARRGERVPPVWYEEEPLVRGQECELVAEIGTPGVGAGTFALLTADIPPADMHPVAEVEFPHRAAKKAAIRRKVELSERCCGTLFKGRIQVPEEAALGKAQVNLSFPGWEKVVASGAGEVTVRDVAPAKAEYGMEGGLAALNLIERLGGTFERDLTIDVKPVTKVDFGSTKVADGDLKQIGELKTLRFVGLGSTAIGDKGLAYLQDLDRLEVIDLHATKVTMKAKSQFLEKHPSVKFGPVPK